MAMKALANTYGHTNVDPLLVLDGTVQCVPSQERLLPRPIQPVLLYW